MTTHNLHFPDASGEIHYSCESLNSKIVTKENIPNQKTSSRIGWDFSGNMHSSVTDVSEQFDRQGPDLFVQNGIPMCLTSGEPIYAEIKKKPGRIFQVKEQLRELQFKIEDIYCYH